MTCSRLFAILPIVVAGILVFAEEYRSGRYDAGTHVLLAVHAAVYGSCILQLAGVACCRRVLVKREGFGWLLFAGLASSGVLMSCYRSLRKWEAVHMVLTTASCVALGSRKLLPPPDRPRPVLSIDTII
jgi:hypothetical protein